MSFEKRTITVEGVKVNLDVDEYAIGDIDQAQRTSTKMIAFWASVWGSAEGELVKADAFYRNWRAAVTEKLLKADPKMAEWKVKAKIESHPDFMKIKDRIAKATDNAVTAKGTWEACIRRSNLAQSVGANKRETLRKMGDDTTKKERIDSDSSESVTVPKSKHETDKRDALKKVLKKDKEKGK